MGTFDQVVDPTGQAGFDRQPRMIPVLVGEEDRPVCVLSSSEVRRWQPRR
jgi:hypothetical protein